MREYGIWLAKLLTLIAVVVVGVPLVLTLVVGFAAFAMKGTEDALIGSQAHKVAVVELSDVIMSSRDTVDELYRQAADESVKAVVLRVDSPGGAVGPSQEIYSAVKKLKSRKPIVASMGGVAASGGLYVSLGASKILAQPGTLTGSIGVILQMPNFTEISQKFGIEMVTIKSGKLKDAGNLFRKMTPEEAEYLQLTVSLSHADFISAVAEGRRIDRAKVEEFADGRVLLGTQAKELGLVDDFGDTYDAARAALELAGITLSADEQPFLYYPADKYREFRRILEAVQRFSLLARTGFRMDYLLQ